MAKSILHHLVVLGRIQSKVCGDYNGLDVSFHILVERPFAISSDLQITPFRPFPIYGQTHQLQQIWFMQFKPMNESFPVASS
jgi:hypothetical protein